MYSEEEFFPYGIEKFLDLVNDKNFWDEETVNRAVNEGGIDGEPVVEGYCDIANDGKELEQGTEFYISIATEERGEYWMRKDLILPFLFEDNNGKTIDGKADNASESIKAYKNKWIIDGENANPTYKHSTELKQPDGERRKLIECIVNNELYTPGDPRLQNLAKVVHDVDVRHIKSENRVNLVNLAENANQRKQNVVVAADAANK